MTLWNFLISVEKSAEEKKNLSLRSLLKTWGKLMKNNFRDRRMKQTQKTATSLITKQLIKAKRVVSTRMRERRSETKAWKCISFTFIICGTRKKNVVSFGLMLKNQQRRKGGAQKKAHAKGNCDNAFLCIIIIKSRRSERERISLHSTVR